MARNSGSQMPLPIKEEVKADEVVDQVKSVPEPEVPKEPEVPEPFLVIATRPGFYRNERKSEGDKFMFYGDAKKIGKNSWLKKI